MISRQPAEAASHPRLPPPRPPQNAPLGAVKNGLAGEALAYQRGTGAFACQPYTSSQTNPFISSPATAPPPLVLVHPPAPPRTLVSQTNPFPAPYHRQPRPPHPPQLPPPPPPSPNTSFVPQRRTTSS